jgi:hypothetical protein
MNKKIKVQMQLLYVLCSLLLECLDILKPTSEKMAKFKDDLIGLCEELNNDVVDLHIVQKGTYLQEISNQVNTVIRKNFKE